MSLQPQNLTFSSRSTSNDSGGSPTRRATATNSNTGSEMMHQLAAAEGLHSPPPPSSSSTIPQAPKSCDSDISVTTKSVASCSALVGETIMESPTSPRSNAAMKKLMMQQQQQQQAPPPPPHHHLAQNKREWMSQKYHAGLSWIQRKRQERQQAALEAQVEEQRRILYQAQHGHSLENNNNNHNNNNNALLSVKTQTSASGSGLQVEHVFYDHEDIEDTNSDDDEDVVPQVRLVEEPPEAPSFILERQQMQLLLEQALPPSIAYSKWKRIYCLARDGDDFGEFLRKCHGKVHTLLVVQTTTDQVFGGYAESPWVPHADGFYGLGQACLFKVHKNENNNNNKNTTDATNKGDDNTTSDDNDTDDSSTISVYKWTGANRYIQVCDLTNRMICLGGGGDSFGLCLEQDFSVGSTGSCDTFRNEPLCNQENFQVLNVEVYGFLLGQF